MCRGASSLPRFPGSLASLLFLRPNRRQPGIRHVPISPAVRTWLPRNFVLAVSPNPLAVALLGLCRGYRVWAGGDRAGGIPAASPHLDPGDDLDRSGGVATDCLPPARSPDRSSVFVIPG